VSFVQNAKRIAMRDILQWRAQAQQFQVQPKTTWFHCKRIRVVAQFRRSFA
jgi:hypothetical protein